MSLLVELDSVASDLMIEFPDSAIKYEIPKEPQSNTFIVRAQVNDFSTESRFTFRIERAYQIIFYHDDPQAALETMDRLARRCLKGEAMIPILDDSLRYIRINSFGYALPVKTESELFSIMAVMPTELRQARDLETYQKIMKVNTRMNPDA